MRSNWRTVLLWGLLLTISKIGSAAEDPADGGRSGDLCLTDPGCRDLYQRARELSRTGDLQQAASVYLKAYERRPASWLLLNHGRILYRLGNLQEAIRSYRRYLESPQGESAARLSKAREYLQRAEAELLSAPVPTPAVPVPAAVVSVPNPPLVPELATPPAAIPSESEPEPAPLVNPTVAGAPQPATLLRVGEPASPLVSAGTPRRADGTGLSGLEHRRPRVPTAAWIGLGISGGLSAVSAITGGLALSGANQLRSAQYVGLPGDDLVALQSQTRALAITTDVLLATAAVGLVVSVVVLARKPKPASTASPPTRIGALFFGPANARDLLAR